MEQYDIIEPDGNRYDLKISVDLFEDHHDDCSPLSVLIEQIFINAGFGMCDFK